MNARRAALFAELAQLAGRQAALLAELAALEGGAVPQKTPRGRRRRGVEPAPQPAAPGPVVSLAEAKARRALRRLGVA